MTTISDRLATILASLLVAGIVAIACIMGAEPDISTHIGDPCPGSDSAGYVLTEVYADGSFRCDFAVAQDSATTGRI